VYIPLLLSLNFEGLGLTTSTIRFNIQQFYVLPTQCIYVFCVDLRTNSDYLPIQVYFAGFHNRSVYYAVRSEYLTIFEVYLSS
jgi:hypothetical protein